MKTLIDTDVLSEVRKPGGSPRVRDMLASARPEDLFLSVISVGEIAYGVARLPAGNKRRELEAWLAMSERHFAHRILAVNRDIAQLWGELAAKAAGMGRVVHPADGLIAATALYHGMRLMTRNVADFEPTGVLIINPWAE